MSFPTKTSAGHTHRRAALYLRVSTGRQAEGDVSLPSQREVTTRFCEAQGWTVEQEFIEPGASAIDDKRPVFQRMLEQAASTSRNFDVICVHAFSRFYRNGAEMELTIRRLKKLGVDVVSVTQPTGDDPSQAMMRQIIGIFDEYTSRENGKNVIRSMRESARQGFWNGSRPPLGYRAVESERRGAKIKKKLEIDPVEAETVRLIYRLYLEGDGTRPPLGVKDTCKWLNSHGYRTRRGSTFGIGPLHRILTSSYYAKGSIPFGVKVARTGQPHAAEDIVEVPLPAIIAPETFALVQEKLARNNPHVTPPRIVNGPTLLAGLAVCGTCGAGMTRSGTKRRQRSYVYYSCAGCLHRGKIDCKGRHIRQEKLDGLILENVKEQLLSPDRLGRILQALQSRDTAKTEAVDARASALKSEIILHEEKLKRLYRSIEDGIIELDDILKDRIAVLKNQRDIAKASLERIATQAAGSMSLTPEVIDAFSRTMRDKLETGDTQLRKAYLQSVISRIEVRDTNIRIMGNTHALAAAVKASGGSTGNVSGFVRDWCGREDSNLHPCYRTSTSS